ncbi:MAG: hypothetical protein AABX93_00265 [Nanoarchaeota archaeon]|mgnify:CR=1 FL=1
MEKKRLVNVLILLSLIAVILILNWSFFMEQITEKKLSPEFVGWINQSKQLYDSNNSYVTCLFDRTCKGTFYLEIETVPETNLSEFEDFLEKYGNISIRYDNRIRFETKDFYQINNFFKNPSISNLVLYQIKPDKMNIPERDLRSCEIDSECVIVNEVGCQPQPKVINKKYMEDVKNYFDLSNSGIVCPGVWNPNIYIFSDTACNNKLCTFIPSEIKLCGFVYEDCKNGEKRYENSSLFYDYNLTCKEIINMCADDEEDWEITDINIEITSPANNSIITTGDASIIVKTDGDATCTYTTIIKSGGLIDEIPQKNMNITRRVDHMQNVSGLQNGKYYTIKIECTNETGSMGTGSVGFLSRIPESYNFSGRFLGETSKSAGLLTKSDLPNLLVSGIFKHSSGIAEYTPILTVYGKDIENSTSGGDLNSSEVLIEIGTDYMNPLYKYKIFFSNEVNFTRESGADLWIQILGDNYKIIGGSTNQKIIFSKNFDNDEFILENEQPVKINNKIINGTYVKFNDVAGIPPEDGMVTIDFYFTMNQEKDYLLVGEAYQNPIFKNIEYYFKSYSPENGAEIYFGQEI